jgi:hypothetical protein
MDRPSVMRAAKVLDIDQGESLARARIPLFRVCHGHVNKKQPLLASSHEKNPARRHARGADIKKPPPHHCGGG